MKKVFTDTSHVAHLWANQLQDEARNSGNFYFNGKTIYSYGSHFPIASHVTNDRGENAILFTERAYSNTTAKHIRVVSQAASHKNVIYCWNPQSTHEQNLSSWLTEAENIAAKLVKAKKPELYLNQLSNVAQRVNTYTSFFDLTIFEALRIALSIGNKAEYLQYNDRKVEFQKAEAERQQKELEKKHKKELKKWLTGESHRLYNRNGFDYLRISDNRIETTQAVKIPLEIGRKIWQQIKDNTLPIGAKILDYEVSEVGKNVKVGCHNFKTDYLLKFGETNLK